MKLKDNQLKEYLIFLNEYKDYVGFNGWTIHLHRTLSKDVDFAEVLPDNQEHILDITLSENFIKNLKERQFNILFHELIHGRLQSLKIHMEQFTDILEEHFVNDITRGFEKALKDKWSKC